MSVGIIYEHFLSIICLHGLPNGVTQGVCQLQKSLYTPPVRTDFRPPGWGPNSSPPGRGVDQTPSWLLQIEKEASLSLYVIKSRQGIN